ncbi:sulfite reductase [NADPH] flavoprotein component, partial [Cryomyces antarcticus]
ASLAAQVASSLAKNGATVGVINVRVYRPFVEEEFLEVLAPSVQNIAVLGQVKDQAAVSDKSEHSSLYTDVLAAVSFSTSLTQSPTVLDIKYAREQVWTPSKIVDVFRKAGRDLPEELDILDSSVQQYTFWNIDESPSVSAPLALGQLLSGDSALNVSVRTGRDNL